MIYLVFSKVWVALAPGLRPRAGRRVLVKNRNFARYCQHFIPKTMVLLRFFCHFGSLGPANMPKVCECCSITSLREQSADLPYQVAWTAGQTPLPHAPGARMTVVHKQTPSNYGDPGGVYLFKTPDQPGKAPNMLINKLI